MSLRPIKVTFHLDGTGLYYDPAEPLMLDGILCAAVVRWHAHGEPPARDEAPVEIPLPLARWKRGGAWGWHASALFPDGATAESLIHWRKRFRQDRVEITTGSPNLANGVYRDWNMPLPLLLAPRMAGYAVGDAHRIRHELKRSIRYLGKKRAHGRGHVTAVEVEIIDQDFSIEKDGRPTRWMPDPAGTRMVRTRAPYWNLHDRHLCREVETVSTS
ncbi:MAG: hypothetical protein ACREIA_10260 [Opitutaceae bacterium]